MRPENRLNLNYSSEANRFAKLSYPIIDVHSHINGERAVELYKKAAREYGIQTTYTMTQLEGCDSVHRILGDSVRFITVPNWFGKDAVFEHSKGYIERLKKFQQYGATIAKFWSAPRIFDSLDVPHNESPLRLNSPERIEAITAAVDLGYKLMVHVSDPDTWFKTKYRDARRYGLKEWHYEPLKDVLSRFSNVPLIAAHMGGYPENLDFLSALLSSHSNLYLDCSATKWVVRELSKYPTAKVQEFFTRWQGRILFGSDIVTAEDHLKAGDKVNEMLAKANSEQEAYDLYASRYWALRTLLETSYDGESPIADPDLMMVEPDKYTALDAPRLAGKSLSQTTLKALYFDAAHTLLE